MTKQELIDKVNESLNILNETMTYYDFASFDDDDWKPTEAHMIETFGDLMRVQVAASESLQALAELLEEVNREKLAALRKRKAN